VNARRSHGLGASPVRLEPQGAHFSLDRAGADASRLLRRKVSEFTLARGIPAGASGAYWPGPQTNNRIFPEEIFSYSPLSLKGYG
jgi:hypothetical protein